MKKEFPLEFTLENGTHVIVKKVDNKKYDFVLKPEDGRERHFLYDYEIEYTTEMEEALDFDQLNALRRFWLEKEKHAL